MATTTIKVPVELRDRISAHAREQGLTIARYLADREDERDREERWHALRESIAASPPDESYRRELQDWDAAMSDDRADG